MDITPEIIKNCINGDETTIHHLYQQCFSLMKGISRRYQKNEDEVEDAMNRSFMKLLKNLDRYNANKPFKSWFSRIIVNTNIDMYRSSKRHHTLNVYVEDYSGSERHESVIMESDLEIDYDEIMGLIDTLSPASKNVFNLYAIDGYSHKEIAKILDISDGTSKWHLSTARKFLKNKIEDHLRNKKKAI